MVTDASVGTFYKSPVKAGVTYWTQPGGPGTIVYPQQKPGEMAALFVMGTCGHFCNSFEVVADTYQPLIGTPGPAAVFICPLCSIVQRIVFPYSLIYADATPILFP